MYRAAYTYLAVSTDFRAFLLSRTIKIK